MVVGTHFACLLLVVEREPLTQLLKTFKFGSPNVNQDTRESFGASRFQQKVESLPEGSPMHEFPALSNSQVKSPE